LNLWMKFDKIVGLSYRLFLLESFWGLIISQQDANNIVR